MANAYLDCLAMLGVGGAHPGGLQLTKKMLAKVEIDRTKTVLDIGCGTGQTSAYMAEKYKCRVTAVDSSKVMVEKANNRFLTLDLPVTAEVGDAQNLLFPDAAFDVILSESVITFTNLGSTISEFKRVLKPRGQLLAVEMVCEQPLLKEEQREITDFYGFTGLFTEEDWSIAFQQAGFTRVTIENYQPHDDEQDLEQAADFSLSEHIDEEFFEIFQEHEYLTIKYREKLGFRMFICGL
ncbi:class I SAM-dependent methyltransferase [Bacillus sp. PK3_68]|uniref:class I SAM-dependent methyltransferase n=1 Tax=Bacillus sp. PK3_68 TaxID=2027408 RepID=UPI000E7209F5|nr:class I SAM-dependent methyltransferase [Bacillus sp. PK3_68]RJS61779.1 SAM-dependent methyltransferase [Bacillus sp. PK3_68]